MCFHKWLSNYLRGQQVVSFPWRWPLSLSNHTSLTDYGWKLHTCHVFCFFFFTHGWDQWFAARNVCLTKWITPSSLNSPVILACTFTFLEVFVVRPQERGEGGVQFASDAGFTLSITQHHNHNPEPTNPPSLLLHLTAEGIRWLQSVLQQARTGVVVGVN